MEGKKGGGLREEGCMERKEGGEGEEGRWRERRKERGREGRRVVLGDEVVDEGIII
jgi:hypothetical protein